MTRPPPRSTLFPYTTLFRAQHVGGHAELDRLPEELHARRAVDPRRALEHLDDDDVLARVDTLTAAALSSSPAPAGRPRAAPPRSAGHASPMSFRYHGSSAPV